MIAMDMDNIFENGTVHFAGNASVGSIREYRWEFGDGSEGTGADADHIYSHVGKYAVQLTVVDTRGASHTDTAYVHVHHYEKHTGTISVGQNPNFMIPVEIDCMGAKITLSYPTGQLVGGKPSNDLTLQLYYPNGTKYGDTSGQGPDAGSMQVRELDIPNQEMAASFYKDWRASVVSATILSVDYDLEMTVRY
jgi:PKD repeat protein